MTLRLIFLSVLTLIFNLSLPAQPFSQGNFMMGGTLGFSAAESSVDVEAEGVSVSNEGARTTQFNIAPAVGYFLLDRWTLGIGMDYTLNRLREPKDINDPNTDYEKSFDSDLLFGPFTRVYLPVGQDKAFFLEATAGFGSSESQVSIDGVSQTVSNDVLAIGIGPGFTILSNDAIGIEAQLKYNWARSNAEIIFNDINTNTQTYTNQIDFSIGLQVYFARIRPAKVENEKPEPANNIEPTDFYD
ncbi:MAG: outer membrane beta-barrel protein [Phaeodactylibacter sp.]|nr:outer membrane beta-barrel protein [Phaeodactylibacter sp.]MCB9294148.1 outer membrane beta-barrel protein [Lewinellaceae bacterium]